MGRGVEGPARAVERHPVRGRRRGRGERRRMRRTNEAEALEDALTHLLHLGNQFRLETGTGERITLKKSKSGQMRSGCGVSLEGDGVPLSGRLESTHVLVCLLQGGSQSLE